MSQQKRSQRKYTAEEKIKILQEGEQGSMSINEVCRRYGITTVTYYYWRNQAREAMLKAFNGSMNKKKSHREQELEEKIARMRNTIVEITEENIELKKKNFR
jgi:transposase